MNQLQVPYKVLGKNHLFVDGDVTSLDGEVIELCSNDKMCEDKKLVRVLSVSTANIYLMPMRDLVKRGYNDRQAVVRDFEVSYRDTISILEVDENTEDVIISEVVETEDPEVPVKQKHRWDKW